MTNIEQFTFIVSMTWRDRNPIDRKEVVDYFTDYLESRDGPFRDDYGPEAWGEYEGPFVTYVEVQEAEPSGVYQNVAVVT